MSTGVNHPIIPPWMVPVPTTILRCWEWVWWCSPPNLRGASDLQHYA
jgi:hypothetical protein